MRKSIIAQAESFVVSFFPSFLLVVLVVVLVSNTCLPPPFFLQVGDKYGTALMNAMAGSLVGIAEIQFLPLDALKVKSQTNPASLALLRSGGNSSSSFVLSVIMQSPKLYRAAGWTAARNSVGSFANFGGIALVKGAVFGKTSFDAL